MKTTSKTISLRKGAILAYFLFYSFTSQLLAQSFSFSAGPNLSVQRDAHATAMLPNGKILVIGGSNGEVTTVVYYKSCSLYNPETNAFETVFALGYQQVCIVGSDCNELTTTIVADAFSALQTNDFVIGPSTDGGYYLLGMQQLLHPLFININWSTDVVLSQTIHAIHNAEKSYFLLPALTDIDEEVSVPAEWL